MTKQNTKRALLMSVLALLLCVSMLVGTTFAWFTDSVTSASNIIKAGNLDVELYWAEGADAVPTAQTGWKDASTDAIFDYDNWEPGYVQARHIKIANVGTLAFKYKLNIVPNGTVDILADVIDVYYIEGARQITRADLATLTPVGTLRELINDTDGVVYGSLLPAGQTATNANERAGAVTATVAFKMRESAGNDYQLKQIGTDFAIKLFATQYTFEEDSYDDQYDAQVALPWTGGVDTAWFDPSATAFNLTSPDQVAGLAKLVNEGEDFTGKTITLSDDVNLNNVNWTPIGNDDYAFNGTFDGDGHTITGLSITSTGDSAFFNCLDADATVKNVNFETANVSAKNAGIVSVCAGGSTIENVHVLSGSVVGTSYAAAFVGQQAWSGATFKNCTNYADVTSGFIAAGFGGYIWYNCDVENCVNYGNITGNDRAAGIAAHLGGTVKNSANNGEIISKGGMPAGGIVAVISSVSTIENCVNNGNVSCKGTDVYNSLAGGILGNTPGSTVTIKNCVNNGNVTANSADAAGIACSQYGKITAIDCENNGDVHGATGAAGTVAASGTISGSNTVTDCVNNGQVTEG